MCVRVEQEFSLSLNPIATPDVSCQTLSSFSLLSSVASAHAAVCSRVYIYEIYIQGVTSPEAVVIYFSHIYSLNCLNKFIDYKNELKKVIINLLSPSYDISRIP